MAHRRPCAAAPGAAQPAQQCGQVHPSRFDLRERAQGAGDRRPRTDSILRRRHRHRHPRRAAISPVQEILSGRQFHQSAARRNRPGIGDLQAAGRIDGRRDRRRQRSRQGRDHVVHRASAPRRRKPAIEPTANSRRRTSDQATRESWWSTTSTPTVKLSRPIWRTTAISVDTVGSGGEAIQMLGSERYDLVLMDIQMPIMDGVTATRRIRAMPHPIRDIPIIAMTANVLPQQVKSFLDAGMNDHIGKPIERAQLYNNVRRWLPKPKSSAPNRAEFAEFRQAEVRRIRRCHRRRKGEAHRHEVPRRPHGGLHTRCTLAEAQQEAHALINCAGVFGLQNLVAACRAIEFVSPDDVDHRLAAMEEVRRERSLRDRRSWATCCRNCARWLSCRPANKASTMAAFARLRWPRLDPEARALSWGAHAVT